MKTNEGAGKRITWNAGISVLLVMAASFFLPAGVVADEKYEVAAERNVEAKMRDGVTLRADIYRPKAEGKFPVLLVRTPYDKTNSMGFGLRGAARGYVVIAQDVRGRFESEGEWYPFKNESPDGYDTVEWAAALPYSNGKVGMFGGSYVGDDAVFGGDREAAAPGGNLPDGDGFELSRWVDVPGRGVRTVVQRIVDVGTGEEHHAAASGEKL
jgi:hypothetical protein